MDTKSERADYGLDAPGVVRNLFAVAAVCLVLYASIVKHAWSGLIHLGPVILDVSGMAVGVGATCLFMGFLMIWASKRGKLGERDRLLDRLQWRGDERVLDVGCGRGLLLIGAMKRATRGTGVGVDLWQAEDLSGNRPEATLQNARIEGVLDRVKVETADMRKLPFPDGSFDTIVSMAAIHNLYKAEQRAEALREIVRVLAPGGQLGIDDIRHLREYESLLRENGIRQIEWLGSRTLALFLAVLTWGNVQPGQVLARKEAKASAPAE